MKLYFFYIVLLFFQLMLWNREQEFPYGGQIILASSIQVYIGGKEKWPFFTCTS